MFSEFRIFFNRKFIEKSGFAVFDQGMFSFSLLIVNILLVRWLSPGEYGSFAVAYSIFILLQSFNTGFLYEPMAVLGPSKYRQNLLKYLNTVIAGHLLISSALFVIIILFSVFFLKSNQTLKYAFLGMGISMPCILLFNLIRKFYYIKLESQKASLSSAIYFLVTLSIITVLHFLECLSPFTAFLTLGITSFVVGLGTLKFFHPEWRFEIPGRDMRDAAIEHFKYGRWVTGSHLITWISSSIYIVILPFFIGMEGTGAFRALLNFSLPVQHLVGALNLLFLPKSSKLYAEKQATRLDVVVSLYTIFVLGLTLTYWLFLAMFGDILVKLIYNGKYLEYANLLWLIGLLPFLSTISLPRSCVLRAMKRPDKVFLSHCIAAAFTIVGVICVVFFGIKGAILGLLVSSAANCLCIFYWYNKIDHTK